MPTLDNLKEKYSPVLQLIEKGGVRLDHLHVQDDKLFMQGAVVSESLKNKIWDQIKAVDPTFSDLICSLTVDTNLPAPAAEAQKYTVKPGDSLSKIAKQFYGDSNQYGRIFEANRDKLSDPNKIQVGQELNIPTA